MIANYLPLHGLQVKAYGVHMMQTMYWSFDFMNLPWEPYPETKIAFRVQTRQVDYLPGIRCVIAIPSM